MGAVKCSIWRRSGPPNGRTPLITQGRAMASLIPEPLPLELGWGQVAQRRVDPHPIVHVVQEPDRAGHTRRRSLVQERAFNRCVFIFWSGRLPCAGPQGHGGLQAYPTRHLSAQMSRGEAELTVRAGRAGQSRCSMP